MIRRIEALDGNYDDDDCRDYDDCGNYCDDGSKEYDEGNCGDLEYGDSNLEDCTAVAVTTAVKTTTRQP
jgi:hypothetical protein